MITILRINYVEKMTFWKERAEIIRKSSASSLRNEMSRGIRNGAPFVMYYSGYRQRDRVEIKCRVFEGIAGIQ